MLRPPATGGDRPKSPRDVFMFTRAPGWEGVRDGTGPLRTEV
jgi:hypothetical protein